MTCSTNDALALAQFVLTRRRRDVDDGPGLRLELVELERPVVHGARQTESEVDERLLAGAIGLEHAADLRHGDVRLVDDGEEVGAAVGVAREVVEQDSPAAPRAYGPRDAAQ
jgi:hypothetical protein